MPQLVIKIVDRGTEIVDPTTNDISLSQTGHMWFELVDDNGNISSHGFAPDLENQGKPFAPGFVYEDDNIKYNFDPSKGDYQRFFEITHEQFAKIKDFANNSFIDGYKFFFLYNYLTNSWNNLGSDSNFTNYYS